MATYVYTSRNNKKNIKLEAIKTPKLCKSVLTLKGNFYTDY